MPNWIYNNVSMSGNSESIEKIFKKYFTNNNFNYDTIIPQPKTKDKCPKEYVCDPEEAHIEACKGREWFNWYNWNYDNWGVKWNACETYIDKDNKLFSFESPWSCPIPVLEKLSKLYPNVVFNVEVSGEIDQPYSFVLEGGDITETFELPIDDEDWNA